MEEVYLELLMLDAPENRAQQAENNTMFEWR